MEQEDKDYFLETADIGPERMNAKFQAYMPESYAPHMYNCCTMFGFRGIGSGRLHHFCTKYKRAIKTASAIKAERPGDRRAGGTGASGKTVDQYNFFAPYLLSARYDSADQAQCPPGGKNAAEETTPHAAQNCR
jgi:hypothetical protein